jgi:DNA-binding response OmpR family regulator
MSIAPHVRRPFILFVDDDLGLRKQVTAHLGSLGLEIVTVGDGDVVLPALRQRKPDLVCIDLTLPRTSGFEICELIRMEPELTDLMILLTGDRASLEARAFSYEAGANSYLSKPYTLAQLALEVQRLLATPDDEGELSLRTA